MDQRSHSTSLNFGSVLNEGVICRVSVDDFDQSPHTEATLRGGEPRIIIYQRGELSRARHRDQISIQGRWARPRSDQPQYKERHVGLARHRSKTSPQVIGRVIRCESNPCNCADSTRKQGSARHSRKLESRVEGWGSQYTQSLWAGAAGKRTFPPVRRETAASSLGIRNKTASVDDGVTGIEDPLIVSLEHFAGTQPLSEGAQFETGNKGNDVLPQRPDPVCGRLQG